jgi:hypothetical protein
MHVSKEEKARDPPDEAIPKEKNDKKQTVVFAEI